MKSKPAIPSHDLGEVRDVTNYDSRHRGLSYLYEVPASRVAKQVIRDRITRSWLSNSDDESWDLVGPDEIDSWITQDLLHARASIESISEQGCSQIGMTAIVMGDVNSVYTLECSLRRQRSMNVACCSEDSFFRARGRSETCTLDVFVALSVSHFTYVHVDSSPIEVQRADVMCDFLSNAMNAGKSGSRLSG